MFDGRQCHFHPSTNNGRLNNVHEMAAEEDEKEGNDDDNNDNNYGDLTSSFSVLPPPLSIIADRLVQAGIFPKTTPPNHVLLNDYSAGQGILPHTDGPAYEPQTATLSLNSSVLLEFTPRRRQFEEGGGGQKHEQDQILVTNPDPIRTAPMVSPSSEKEESTASLISSSSGTKNVHSNLLETVSVMLESGSWIIFANEMYTDYCHGIAVRDYDITEDHCLNVPSPGSTYLSRKQRYSLTFRHKKGWKE